jgi:hypothetical protein
MAGERDRRRSERSRLAGFAAIRTIGFGKRNDQALSAVIDVSRHGARLRTGQPPEVGDLVHLRLGVGDVIHDIEGVTRRVEWVDMVYDVGIEWIGCTQEQLAFLDAASPMAAPKR